VLQDYLTTQHSNGLFLSKVLFLGEIVSYCDKQTVAAARRVMPDIHCVLVGPPEAADVAPPDVAADAAPTVAPFVDHTPILAARMRLVAMALLLRLSSLWQTLTRLPQSWLYCSF
jgi:hypothetical protein